MDDFTRAGGSGAARRYWIAVPGTSFDLHVPEDMDGAPDADSIAFSATVLPRVREIGADAVQHVFRYVDAERLGLAGRRPDLTAVFCDAGGERVEVSFSWQGQPHTLWTVAFRWDSAGRRTLAELTIHPF